MPAPFQWRRSIDQLLEGLGNDDVEGAKIDVVLMHFLRDLVVLVRMHKDLRAIRPSRRQLSPSVIYMELTNTLNTQ